MKTVCLSILLALAAVALRVAEPQENPGQEQSNQGAGKVLDLAPNKILDLTFRVEDISKG